MDLKWAWRSVGRLELELTRGLAPGKFLTFCDLTALLGHGAIYDTFLSLVGRFRET